MITILEAMRPRQWLKNLFVFAGLLFTLDAHHPASDYLRVGLAFALFCVLSGSVYLLNDILDAERDRKHERKCRRPVASGRLSEKSAYNAFVASMALGLGGSFVLGLEFGAVGLLYLLISVAYSARLKEVVILDVMLIASGFVLRAAAGAIAIDVQISRWLLMCTTVLALLLALAKRREELLALDVEAGNHRPSLDYYTVPFVDQMINISASATIISYALYTFFSSTGRAHPYLMGTVPFVIYGIFRYLFLIQRRQGVESPELLVVRDRPLLINILLWGVTSALIVGLGR
jgi:4-hydroxybenzoate polyprenyltransferase